MRITLLSFMKHPEQSNKESTKSKYSMKKQNLSITIRDPFRTVYYSDKRNFSRRFLLYNGYILSQRTLLRIRKI